MANPIDPAALAAHSPARGPARPSNQTLVATFLQRHAASLALALAATLAACGTGDSGDAPERGVGPSLQEANSGVEAVAEGSSQAPGPEAEEETVEEALPTIEELAAQLETTPAELTIVSDPALRMEGDPKGYPMPATVGGAPVVIVRERHPTSGVLMRIKTVRADSASAESGPVLHGPEWTYFDTAVLSSIQWWRENVAHGPAQHWWRVGTQKSAGRFKDGERDGLRREYAKNGQLKTQGAYRGGMPFGVHEEWFPSGQRMQTETYLGGALDGPRKIWDRDGLLVLSENYDEGVRHGRWTDYHPGDGDPREWGEFDQGQRVGIWQRGSPDGVNLETVPYVADRRQGLARLWNPAGGLIEEVTYARGVKTGPRRTWYDDGVLQSEGKLEEGLRIGYWVYQKASGELNELWSGEYEEDQRIGPGTPPPATDGR